MFPKWLQEESLFIRREESQKTSPPSLCQADRRVQSAGGGSVVG